MYFVCRGFFKALAEIFDFAAGLMQRVPKKTNEVKFDLLNSTAVVFWGVDARLTPEGR